MVVTKKFIDTDFLLQTQEATDLYEKHAADQPIIDYHNHLSPKDIFENRKFSNITEVWLEGDHYKWRAMRSNGVAEHFCTGNASPEEKFLKWAETVPNTLRNPLYHWTQLELKSYFGIETLLDKNSAREIYEQCNDLLAQDEFKVQGLLKKMKVETLCTTDDPCDSLMYHGMIAGKIKMLPTFRPDKAFTFDDAEEYWKYLTKLSEASSVDIYNFQSLLQALENRVNYFHEKGCRLSDHGLEQFPLQKVSETHAGTLFNNLLIGKALNAEEANSLRAAILFHLCRLYHSKGWVQQFHVGALRNNNTRMMRKLGRDTGFDSIGDFSHAQSMSRFLDTLDKSDQLAKTILYNLNPADNELFATMIGNFNDGSIPGKIQWGSGWWFLDQKDGIEKQMNVLSNMGLLSRFIGMTTDSRSFLSFPRHEYFRRVLCNMLGADMAKGEIPNDPSMVGKLVQDICYHNAKNYFSF